MAQKTEHLVLAHFSADESGTTYANACILGGFLYLPEHVAKASCRFI